MSDEVIEKPFADSLDKYVSLVCRPGYIRCMRGAILCSFIPLFYIFRNLSVEQSVDSNQPASSTVWGISIDGITNENLLMIFLVLNLYYGFQFAFAFLKVYAIAKPFSMFWKIWRFVEKPFDKEAARYGHLSSAQTLGGPPPTSELLARDEKFKNPQEVAEFILRRPFFGLLEHLFGKMIFPLGLSIFATVCLVREIWF